MGIKISIITVSYNSEKHIESTIRSVINQTYKDIEYIIIDGGSSDRTVEIINKYRDKIAYFVSEPDKGISDAFNKGVKAATGDIIGIVNSDDQLLDDCVIEKVVQRFEPQIDIYRGAEIVKNYETGYEYILRPTTIFSKNPISFHVCHMATFIRKDAFEKYGYYDVNYKYAMDLEILYRFNYKGATTKQIDDIVGVFRLGGVSQTYNKAKRLECEKIIRNTGGSVMDVFLYKVCLICKDCIRQLLNCFGKDLASKIRYGRKE